MLMLLVKVYPVQYWGFTYTSENVFGIYLRSKCPWAAALGPRLNVHKVPSTGQLQIRTG